MAVLFFSVTGLVAWFHLIDVLRIRKRSRQIREAVHEATGINLPLGQTGLALPALALGGAVTGFAYLLLASFGNPQASSAASRAIVEAAAAILLLVVLPWIVAPFIRVWAGFSVRSPLARADYQSALTIAERILRWFPGVPTFLFLRGTTLLFAGRLAEAERMLLASLEKGQNEGGVAQLSRLANLGYVWLMQGRSNEARAAFSGVAKVSPRNLLACEGLATVCLRHDKDARRALEMVSKALDAKIPAAVPGSSHTVSYLWADKAQSLAMLGRFDEAASGLAKADTQSLEFVPGCAGILWRCGLALNLMNRPDDASERFKRAFEIDPNGLYGQLAREELESAK